MVSSKFKFVRLQLHGEMIKELAFLVADDKSVGGCDLSEPIDLTEVLVLTGLNTGPQCPWPRRGAGAGLSGGFPGQCTRPPRAG